jgi:hypothetical protein
VHLGKTRLGLGLGRYLGTSPSAGLIARYALIRPSPPPDVHAPAILAGWYRRRRQLDK